MNLMNDKKTVWHDSTVRPRERETIIWYDTEFQYPECGELYPDGFYGGGTWMDWDKCKKENVRWAYFKDLIEL